MAMTPSPASAPHRLPRTEPTPAEVATADTRDAGARLAAMLGTREREAIAARLCLARGWPLDVLPRVPPPDDPTAGALEVNVMQIVRAFEPIATGGTLHTWRRIDEGGVACIEQQVADETSVAVVRQILAKAARHDAHPCGSRCRMTWRPAAC